MGDRFVGIVEQRQIRRYTKTNFLVHLSINSDERLFGAPSGDGHFFEMRELRHSMPQGKLGEEMQKRVAISNLGGLQDLQQEWDRDGRSVLGKTLVVDTVAQMAERFGAYFFL